MQQGQSLVKRARITFEHVGVELASTVFKLFHIETLAVLKKLMAKVKQRFQGSQASSIRVQSGDSINWKTFLVHLCEIKQLRKKFGISQLRQVFQAFAKATHTFKKEIRVCHKTLMAQASAGSSKCHAVHMVEQAAHCMGLKLKVKKSACIQGD